MPQSSEQATEAFTGFLTEAATEADRHPDDVAQGRVLIVLATGRAIRGRLASAHDGIASFAENEHDGHNPAYMLHVRIDSIVSFQYI